MQIERECNYLLGYDIIPMMYCNRHWLRVIIYRHRIICILVDYVLIPSCGKKYILPNKTGDANKLGFISLLTNADYY